MGDAKLYRHIQCRSIDSGLPAADQRQAIRRTIHDEPAVLGGKDVTL